MEVHHHSHTPRNKWIQYFWEFLMLFLAVTLGFLVENQREHFIEKQRARQYATSLIEDLKVDAGELDTSIFYTKYYALSADTLLLELDKSGTLQNDTILQRLTNRLIRYSFYDPTLGTYNQIKNSGSLRYFNIEVVKKLNKYETFASYILKISNQQLDFRNEHLLPLIYKIQNTRLIRSLNKEINYVAPVSYEKPGKQITDQWYTYAYHIKVAYTLIASRMGFQKKNAEELIELLEKKYSK